MWRGSFGLALEKIKEGWCMNIEQIYDGICKMLETIDEKEMAQNRVYNELIGNLTFAKYDAEILLGKKSWPIGY